MRISSVVRLPACGEHRLGRSLARAQLLNSTGISPNDFEILFAASIGGAPAPVVSDIRNAPWKARG